MLFLFDSSTPFYLMLGYNLFFITATQISIFVSRVKLKAEATFRFSSPTSCFRAFQGQGLL